MKNILPLRSRSVAAAACVAVLLFAAASSAQSSNADREMTLNSKIERLDRSAGLPHGEEAVKGRLSKTFNVPVARISELVERNPGYGELMVVLAIAEKMAGGLTDGNINKVLKLRQDHKGWGEITRNVDVKLSSVVNRVDTIEKNAQNDVKKAAMEKSSAGRGAGGKDRAGNDRR
jgi:hypothetical protein